MPGRSKKLNIKIGKHVVYHLYVGIGVPMDRLETEGKTLEFKSGRERLEFRRMLEEEKPKTMEQIRILYELYIM